MEFEWDEEKSKTNKTKHGILFSEAVELWFDRHAWFGSATSTEEERVMIVARFQSKMWAAIYTMRGEITRIISVRRARKNEEANYENSKKSN